MDIIIIAALIPLGLIYELLQGLQNTFDFLLPTALITSITTAFTYLGYLNGVLPIDTLIICISILAGFYFFLYTTRIILWLWGLLPWIGKQTDLPTVDLRHNETKSNTIDLRRGFRSKAKPTIRDIR